MEELYIKVGIDHDTNRLILTDAGIGILKAILMKWMEDAERGMATAREMGKVSDGPYPPRQYEYYKNALAYLSGKIFNIRELHGYDLNKMLRLVKRWADGKPIPDAWYPLLLHSIEVETGGTGSTPSGGSRSDGNQLSRPNVHGEAGGDAGDSHPAGNRRHRSKGGKGTGRSRPKKRP